MLTDLKDLEKFLKICRKQGVSGITVEGVTVRFGDMPRKDTDDDDEIPTDELSPDEMIFYAVNNQGKP